MAALARALLSSGFLPVLPHRPVHYQPGPLRRAERLAPPALPATRTGLDGLGKRLAPIAAATIASLGFAILATLLVLSRTRAWRLSHPLIGARDGPAFREAASVLALIRLSRFRRWRRRHLGPPATWQLRRVLWAADAALVRILAPAEVTGPKAAYRPVSTQAPSRRPTRTAAAAIRPVRPQAAAVAIRVPLAKVARPARALGQATLVGTAALAALALGIALSFLPSAFDQAADPNPVQTGSLPRLSRDAAPPSGAEPPARIRDVTTAKLPDAPLSAIQAARGPEPYRIAWPFDIVDGLTFGPEGAVKTHLAGLEGPPRDGVCNDRDGRPWACGLQARAALNNITRRQALLCEPVGTSATGVLIAQCRGDIDLARELVSSGFARPTVPDSDLQAAMDDARRNERGLWNGGWTIRTSFR